MRIDAVIEEICRFGESGHTPREDQRQDRGKNRTDDRPLRLERLDTTGRTGPVVECWTPSGSVIRIKARDQRHAEWLRKMNPPPTAAAASHGKRSEGE